MASLVQARDSFVTEVPGYPRVIQRDELFRDDDPIVKFHRAMFKEVTLIEQATAAPGERRNR